jgi:hypothetical protein
MSTDERFMVGRVPQLAQAPATARAAFTPQPGSRKPARFLLVAVCVTALGLVTPGLAAAAKPVKVTSTLDGKTVLPRHLRWVAMPKLAASQIQKVEFLIDGKLRWVEQEAPYVYGSDEAGLHKGYLVTTWLTPGRHRFSVRVVAGNRTGSDTVTARVLPAPSVPSALAGSWQRTVPGPIPADPNAASTNPVPGGVYSMTFDAGWVSNKNPGPYTPITNGTQPCNGCITLQDYLAGSSTLQIWGAVTTNLITANNPVGGWWCFEDGPPARYSLEVSGDTLTLAPIGGQDPCHQRGSVWSGTWTRA